MQLPCSAERLTGSMEAPAIGGAERLQLEKRSPQEQVRALCSEASVCLGSPWRLDAAARCVIKAACLFSGGRRGGRRRR